MSEKYQKVKKSHDSGLWNVKMARNAAEKKWITADEFEEITGMKY